MIQRAPERAGWTRDNVTVPITSAMRMTVQLPQRTGDTRGAPRLAGGTQSSQHLPDLEKSPARHFYNEQVGPQRQDGAGRLGHGQYGRGPESRHLIGHAADHA